MLLGTQDKVWDGKLADLGTQGLRACVPGAWSLDLGSLGAMMPLDTWDGHLVDPSILEPGTKSAMYCWSTQAPGPWIPKLASCPSQI